MEEQFSNEYLDEYMVVRYGVNIDAVVRANIYDIANNYEEWTTKAIKPKPPPNIIETLAGLDDKPRIIQQKINFYKQLLNRAKYLFYKQQTDARLKFISNAPFTSKLKYDRDKIADLLLTQNNWNTNQYDNFLNDYIPTEYHEEFKNISLKFIDAKINQYIPKGSFEEQPPKKLKETGIDLSDEEDRIADDVISVNEFERIPIDYAIAVTELYDGPAQRERERVQAEAEQRRREEEERRILNQQRAQYIADMDARQQQLESGICVIF